MLVDVAPTAAEYFPTGHPVQLAIGSLAPWLVPYLPAGQSLQRAWPAAFWYFPSLQARQSVTLSCPSELRCFPSGQSLQTVKFPWSLYLPTLHNRQLPTSAYQPSAQSCAAETHTDRNNGP